jgi:hypothetical protein
LFENFSLTDYAAQHFLGKLNQQSPALLLAHEEKGEVTT